MNGSRKGGERMITKENLFGGYMVECDSCGFCFSYTCDAVESATVKNAISDMRDKGWSIGKKENLCPSCRERKKQK